MHMKYTCTCIYFNMYIYIYTYMYIYSHIYIYIYTHIHTYAYTFSHPYLTHTQSLHAYTKNTDASTSIKNGGNDQIGWDCQGFGGGYTTFIWKLPPCMGIHSHRAACWSGFFLFFIMSPSFLGLLRSRSSVCVCLTHVCFWHHPRTWALDLYNWVFCACLYWCIRMCDIWLIWIRDMTHVQVWHDPCTCMQPSSKPWH